MHNREEEILSRLNNVYCRIKNSGIAGVGIVAIRPIPKGVNPFEGINDQPLHRFHISQLQHLHEGVLKMIEDFYVVEKDGTVLIPEYGLNGMDISFFLNSSDSPNMETIDGGHTFIASREIQEGEELTVSYETYEGYHHRGEF